MIADINNKYGLEGDDCINPSTIRSRLDAKRNISVDHEGNTSPLDHIESVAVDLLIRCGEMNQPLSCEQGLDLIRSLVLKDDLKEEKLNWIKSNCHPKSEDDDELLGKGYWRNFMKRNKHKLRSQKGRLFPQSRDEWCTLENIKEMYNMIYNLLTSAGVAEDLQESCYMDKLGNIVEEGQSYGLKVEKKIKHPDYFIHVDEFGDSLDMTRDKLNGSQKKLCGVGIKPNISVSSTNLHYTVLGFTAANGVPIMCAIILTRDDVDDDDGIKINVVTGIDVLSQKPIDMDNLQDSFDEGGVFSGGPKCNFHGKEIPCYVTTSKKGGMNSKILTALFKYMDDLELFPRIDGGPIPFVLIDGHGSRFGLEFLTYINDPKHKWCVCLGLPYGTHKWQVADSEEQNGAMRCSIGKVKRDRLKRKKELGFKSLSVFDVVLIVKEAWKDSFARVDSNKKALCERGWNPLNYALLTDESLIERCNNGNNNDTIDISKLSQLNVDDGIASDVVTMLYNHQDLTKKRKRTETKRKRTETSQNILNEAKKITSGLVFSAGKVHLDNHILSIVKKKSDEQKAKRLELDKKNEHRKVVKENMVNKIISSGSSYKSWTNEELKVMCSYYKKKGYPAIPARKTDLHVYWKQIVNESPENFLNAHVDNTVVDDEIDDDVKEQENIDEVLTSVSL